MALSVKESDLDPSSSPVVVIALMGLIIDNRFNEGGVDRVLKGTLVYFSNGLLGHFISRQDEKPLEVAGVDISGSQKGPLVVLVGPRTNSFGEIFAGVLQDIGRAYIFGETTAGNVETLRGYNFVDGSRAWIAYRSFQPLMHPEQNWEGTGIVPDFPLEARWEDYILDHDPLIQAAIGYIIGVNTKGCK
jgi:carboxyl-terminal processing protease